MNTILIAEIIIGALILLFLLLPRLSLAPWVPMRKEDLERINQIADLKSGETFYEIGSGDGRVCHYIAKRNPDAKVIGIEISPFLYLVSRLKNLFWPQKNLTLKFGNALKQDLSGANKVYTFAMIHSINKKLKDKFKKELKKGSKVISYDCPIFDWEGPQSTNKPHEKAVPIHIYEN